MKELKVIKIIEEQGDRTNGKSRRVEYRIVIQKHKHKTLSSKEKTSWKTSSILGIMEILKQEAAEHNHYNEAIVMDVLRSILEKKEELYRYVATVFEEHMIVRLE